MEFLEGLLCYDPVLYTNFVSRPLVGPACNIAGGVDAWDTGLQKGIDRHPAIQCKVGLLCQGVNLFLSTKVIEEGRDLLFSVGRPVVPDF